MILHFYLGRAGSGKTWRCLHDIADELRRDPSPRSPRLVWLLPEQATAQAEQALLRQPGIQGFARAQILSFKRLAGMVESELGGGGLDFLDEQGRQMLLRAILGRHREELEVFGGSASQAGFIARLAATFTELAHFRHGFDELEAQASRLAQESDGDALLVRKLRDLVRIGRHWDAETRERFSDPSHFLDSLSERLERSRILDGALVWVDGFSSFMPQELRVLEQVMRLAREMRVALLLDPARLGELGGSGAGVDPTRLYAQTEETWLRLRAMAVEGQIQIGDSRTLPEEGQPTRFSPSPFLEGLESRLSDCGMVAVGKDEAAPVEPVTGLPDGEMLSMVCVEAADTRCEVEAVARAIRRLGREAGERYRDMAVVVRDMETYEGLIRTVFERHGISCFIDRRRPLAHHPLVELLRSSVRAVDGDWGVDDVVHYLKTDFAPVSRDEADCLENHALKHAVRGIDWWVGERSWTNEEDGFDLDAVRIQALTPLRDLHHSLRDARNEAGIDGAAFADILVSFVRGLSCDETLRFWSDQARETGDLDAAEEHEQVWDMIMALLARMRETLIGEVMPLDELAGVLEAGLASLALGLVPPSLDEVLVGSIERSRQPDLRTVFVLGMNDNVFPQAPSEDVVFTDSERQALRERCGFELAPTAAVRLFRERYLGYVAMTRASRHLWVSWAAADAEGRALRPSPFVEVLRRAAPPGAMVRYRVDEEWLATCPGAVETASQAAEGVVRGRVEKERGESGLWECVASRSGEVEGLESSLATVEGGKVLVSGTGRESVAFTEESLPDTISVSRLEAYARCPFQYFAQYVLRLGERVEFQIQPLDIGLYHHEILRRVFEKLRARHGNGDGLDWGRVPSGDALSALDEALDEVSPEFLEHGPLGESQVDFYRERSRRILGLAVEDLVRHGRIDRFMQVRAEVEFGWKRSDIAALEIPVPEGRTMRLHGTIDRIDAARVEGESVVRVIDFKSSDNRLPLARVAAGLSLQLPLYLLAVVEGWREEVSPSGMYFYPVRHSMASVSAPEEGTGATDGDTPSCKLQGLMDVETRDAYDVEFPGGRARTVGVGLKKDGAPSAGAGSADWVPDGALRTLCEWALREASSLGMRLQGGHVGVEPVRFGSYMPCGTCAFGDVCRVDLSRATVRNIPPASRQDLLDDLAGGTENPRDC